MLNCTERSYGVYLIKCRLNGCTYDLRETILYYMTEKHDTSQVRRRFHPRLQCHKLVPASQRLHILVL